MHISAGYAVLSCAVLCCLCCDVLIDTSHARLQGSSTSLTTGLMTTQPPMVQLSTLFRAVVRSVYSTSPFLLFDL